MAIKGGDIASTVSGIVENVATIASPTASLGQKAMAVADIALDVATGVNTKDVKAGVAAAEKVAETVKGLPKVPTDAGSVPKSERDPKRFFTPSEREAKRAEQGEQCANGCGTAIDASNSAGHHIERHADGGRSVSENHAEVCLDCHAKIHKAELK